MNEKKGASARSWRAAFTLLCAACVNGCATIHAVRIASDGKTLRASSEVRDNRLIALDIDPTTVSVCGGTYRLKTVDVRYSVLPNITTPSLLSEPYESMISPTPNEKPGLQVYVTRRKISKGFLVYNVVAKAPTGAEDAVAIQKCSDAVAV